MKTTILKKTTLFLIPVLALSACNDDDMLMGDSASNNENVVVEDQNIIGLLTMLDDCSSVNLTVFPLTKDDANLSNDIHNVHYFDGNSNVEKQYYQEAYENGHYFIVSDNNANKLNEILERKSSVEISTSEVFSDICDIETVTDSVNDASSRGINGVEMLCDTIVGAECVISMPESNYYQLFNKNMEMIVAIPEGDMTPHLALESILDAIYKYQDVSLESRADNGLQLASDPVLYSWEYKYTYKVDGKQVHENRQRISASYTISGCYSYNSNRDYYMLQQEVMTYNAQLATFKKTIKDYYKGRDYYVYAGFSKGARLKAVLGASSDSKLGTANNNKFHLIQTSPATTQNGTTVTTGINYSINGNIGVSGSVSPSGPQVGVSGGISGGATFVDTRATSIPDVSVKNVCGSGEDGKRDDARYTEWQFDIAEPYSHSDYFSTSHCRWAIDEVPNIGKTTATYIASHIWAIDNPTKDFNPIIGISVTGVTGCSAGSQTLFGQQYTHKYTKRVWKWVTIKLDTPYRD